MSHQADSFALSPFAFGEMFFAGAAAMQQQIAEGMMAVFDAVAEAMSDSLRAGTQLAHDIGNAETPVHALAAGYAWFQGRAERGLTWFRTRSEPMTAAPAAPAVTPQPTSVRRAPVLPQTEARIASKPPAGKLRRAAPIVIEKLPKKAARPAAK